MTIHDSLVVVLRGHLFCFALDLKCRMYKHNKDSSSKVKKTVFQVLDSTSLGLVLWLVVQLKMTPEKCVCVCVCVCMRA